MKRTILYLLAITFMVWPAEADDYSDGTILTPAFIRALEERTRSRLIHRTPGNGTDDCSSVYSCMDCNTVRICRPNVQGGYDYLTVRCPSNRPYCDERSGSCVQRKPQDCTSNDNFVCMGNGHYPDKLCYIFHACINYESLMLQCLYDNEVYNPYRGVCEPGAECGRFDCAGRAGQKVAHTFDPKYFAYCAKKNSTEYAPLVIDSCPGSYELNETSQECEAVCHYDGTVEDLEDCHHYYRCTLVYLTRTISYMEKKRLMCPKGQGYSQKDFLCVDQTKIDNCS